MRLTLAIETSNPAAWTPGAPHPPGVALGRVAPGGVVELLGVEPLDPARPHDDGLMPAIDRLFRRAGRMPREIERVAVSVGPGGFTAVRLAVVTGAFIAHACGVPCVAVPSAMVAAARARPGPEPLGVALSSKGATAYVVRFADGRGDEGGVVDANGLIGLKRLLADRFLPDEMRGAAAGLGIAIEPIVFDPAACLEASASRPDSAPAELRPIYPREPEAVTKWRALHPSPRTRNVGDGPGA